MDFKTSETKTNLMRAFAGESQARNRYTFAASQAKKEGLQLIENVFLYTAGQEKEHAEVFYNHLRAMAGETIVIDNAGYPIDLADSTLQLLRMAQGKGRGICRNCRLLPYDCRNREDPWRQIRQVCRFPRAK